MNAHEELGSLRDDLPPVGCDSAGDMTCYEYVADFMKMMFTMRSQKMLTDVVLEVRDDKVGAKLYHAHKVVLAAASPYFKAMFTGGLRESGLTRVPLQGVCPSTVERLVHFMYTGKVCITEENVVQLLPAASMYQISKLIEACCAFLERQLDPSNAVGFAKFAELHDCADLMQKANQVIERHFTEVCKGEEFLELSHLDLIRLILVESDGLSDLEEREVYDAVLSWATHDAERRQQYMKQILQAVRCHYLKPGFLQQQIDTCAVLNEACREYLEDILQDLKLNAPRIIYVAGGCDEGIFEAFNVDDNRWTTLPRLPEPLTGLGVACLKGRLYAVGGRTGSPSWKDCDRVDVYDPASEQWRPCRPMSRKRSGFGVAVMDEFLYAVGGCSEWRYHESVERYDPETDTWTPVAAMRSVRVDVRVAVVNRRLYAIGGWDTVHAGGRWLRTVECYHPDSNSWTEVAPMNVARGAHGVAALGQYIYVAGGHDKWQQLSSVERYDTQRDRWESVAPMAMARDAPSLAAVDDKLYAIGGYKGLFPVDTVEVYDPATDTWRSGTRLTSARARHAAAAGYQHVMRHQKTPPPPPGMRRRRSPSAGLASDAAAHHPPA